MQVISQNIYQTPTQKKKETRGKCKKKTYFNGKAPAEGLTDSWAVGGHLFTADLQGSTIGRIWGSMHRELSPL